MQRSLVRAVSFLPPLPFCVIVTLRRPVPSRLFRLKRFTALQLRGMSFPEVTQHKIHPSRQSAQLLATYSGANNFPLESCKREKTFYMILRESYSPRRAMLEAVLAAERRAATDYTQRAREADELGDKGLAVQLEDMVRDESGHSEETERMLRDWPL